MKMLAGVLVIFLGVLLLILGVELLVGRDPAAWVVETRPTTVMNDEGEMFLKDMLFVKPVRAEFPHSMYPLIDREYAELQCKLLDEGHSFDYAFGEAMKLYQNRLAAGDNYCRTMKNHIECKVRPPVKHEYPDFKVLGE
jgi:hypothetical protein